ncbi:MAG: hypothetical protein ACRD12_01235 [Acidimicrobiales bacterium]
MRSRLALALLAILASTSLAVGCGGGDDDENVTTPPTTAASGQPATSDAATGSGAETYRQCVEAARNVPDPAARKAFQDRCEQIPR